MNAAELVMQTYLVNLGAANNDNEETIMDQGLCTIDRLAKVTASDIASVCKTVH